MVPEEDVGIIADGRRSPAASNGREGGQGEEKRPTRALRQGHRASTPSKNPNQSVEVWRTVPSGAKRRSVGAGRISTDAPTQGTRGALQDIVTPARTPASTSKYVRPVGS